VILITSDESRTVDFQWPEAIARENEDRLRQIALDSTVNTFPFRCRKVLDGGVPLPAEQLMPLLNWLQELDARSPRLAEDTEPEHAILGGMAVLVVFHLDWLLEDPRRIAWCRTKLEAVANNPPQPAPFDSELAKGGYRWDDFAAECGVRLLAADKSDQLARKLVAQGITGFHYDTIGLTMARAFAVRDQIGDAFDQLITLAVRRAALGVLRMRAPHALDADNQEWLASKAALIQEFIEEKLSSELPDLKRINSDTLAAYESLQRKIYPEFQVRSRRGSSTSILGGSREEIYPEMFALDDHVLAEALAWLDPNAAQSSDERARWLTLIRALLQLTLETVPVLEDPDHQEIRGLPSEFDGWVSAIVSRAIPRLTPAENPDSLWKPILDLGASAHDWVERFFWSWFTNGLRASDSPSDFVRVWRSMILYVIASPLWDGSAAPSYHLDEMVIELLGLNARWGALAADEKFAPALATMVNVFGQSADKWFHMPRVVRNFLYFVVQPAATQLLLPALSWISKAVASFSNYDWRDGIEEGLVEYLRICWQRARETILANPALQKSYFALLASVVSRGGHAAIALRDRVAGSTAA
jgi:hypothetical protein